MERFSDRCADLASPSYANFAISLIILLGILFSYVPQHYRLIARRSSEGISPYFVLLGTTCGTCSLGNILSLPASRADLACCTVNSRFACFAGALGILQVAAQWLCFTIILLLFVLFFPRASALAPPNPPTVTPSYSTAVIITGICIVHALVVAVANLVIVAKAPDRLQSYANTLGVMATVLAFIQYFPQIYTTWRLKTVASLSIPMMCIQTPGGYLWAASLAARLGWEGWSTWAVYMAAATLQGCLLIMAVVFELRIRRRKQAIAEGREDDEEETDRAGAEVGEEAEDGETRGSDETTPLIGNNKRR